MSTATMIRHAVIHDGSIVVVQTVSTPTEFFALVQLYAVMSSGRTSLISSTRFEGEPQAIAHYEEFMSK